MNETINQRIALYRKLANLTQTEAAEKLGMKCSTYSQMERKGSISAEKLLALSELFGITPETLLFDTKRNSANEQTSSQPVAHFGTLKQAPPPTDSSFNPSPFIFTHKEENIIKILRNLPRADYDEVIDFINTKYKCSKNK